MTSKEQDYLARGFDKKDPDFRTDDLILQKALDSVTFPLSDNTSNGALEELYTRC